MIKPHSKFVIFIYQQTEILLRLIFLFPGLYCLQSWLELIKRKIYNVHQHLRFSGVISNFYLTSSFKVNTDIFYLAIMFINQQKKRKIPRYLIIETYLVSISFKKWLIHHPQNSRIFDKIKTRVYLCFFLLSF